MSPAVIKKLPPQRRKLAELIESKRATHCITSLLLLNALTLGLETDAQIMDKYGTILHWLDTSILVMFSIEIAIKCYAYRLLFFRSGWNVFDLLIVGIAWVPTGGSLSVLRTLRILRVVRLLSVVPQMRRVISALGYSIPGMLSIVGVLGLIFYVGAVLSTKIFGMHPNPNMQEWFGSISASLYTLFQVMTLESWSMGIVRPTMELFPWSWVFFVPFIIITSFAVLNFFIGIIVDSMQIAQELDATEKQTTEREQAIQGKAADAPLTQKDLQALNKKLDTITRELKALQKN